MLLSILGQGQVHVECCYLLNRICYPLQGYLHHALLRCRHQLALWLSRQLVFRVRTVNNLPPLWPFGCQSTELFKPVFQEGQIGQAVLLRVTESGRALVARAPLIAGVFAVA